MGLNQSQKKAVSHEKGPCQVLAGPGSGKTMTIVNRVLNLIRTCGVRPEDILVITFTRHAASEMKTRLCTLVGKSHIPVTTGTFHGIYYGILKWAYKLGPHNILSEEEKFQILRSVVNWQDSEGEDEEEFLRDVAEEIGRVKNNGADIYRYVSDTCAQERFRDIYNQYEMQRKSLRKIDFDDMLVSCFELFTSRPDILAKWQKKFRYILVDEFQDINRIQYEVLRMLSLPENNLFVVGDDDQAIYGFRGADPQIMFQFREDYPDAPQILLDVNYRSTSNIVNNALKVIRNNDKRFEKKIFPARQKGEFLHIQELKNTQEEAAYVADEVQKRLEKGISEKEMAVLFRIHTDARPLVEELIRRKVPFYMREHLPDIYEHFIAKDLQAYCRLAVGDADRRDFLLIMNRPKRYLGRDSVSQGASFEEIRKYYFDKDWMVDRVDQFEWDVKMLAGMAPYAAIQYIRKKIGYNDFLKDYAYTHRIARSDLDSIFGEIEEAAKPFSSIAEWFAHIEACKRELQKQRSQKQNEGDGVRLMTLHAAKGLEFDTVFLIRANEGQIPYQKARTDEEVEEERRLFYVGMTRAKEVLKICYVKEKNGKEASPSRFVEELLGK